MTIKFIAFTTTVLLLLATASFAQKAPRFTSAYTSLGTGCRIMRGPGGTDDASMCRGLGGYQIRIYGSAAAAHISAEKRGSTASIALATVSPDFDERKTRLEWRMANGKPFAIIIRLPKYAEPTADDPYFPKVVGQELIIRGLPGFDIDLTVDAKDPNANAKARSQADAAYSSLK